MRNTDQDKLTFDLSEATNSLYEKTRLHAVVEFYNTKLKGILDTHAPLKKRKIPVKPSPPWLTNSIVTMIRHRRRLERSWSLDPTNDQGPVAMPILNLIQFNCNRPQKYQSFVFQRKLTKQAINKAQCEFFSEQIEKCKKNPKELYNVCNKMLGRKQSLPLHEHTSPS